MNRPKTHLPLTKVLLNFLSGLGEATIEFGRLANALSTRHGSAYRRGGYEYVKELKRLSDKRSVREALGCLARSRYVKAQKIGTRLMITLTNKGQVATMALRLRIAPTHKSNFFTIVIFDIPESQRTARNQLRLLLKQGGFKLLQHSVWISQRDAHGIIADFVRRQRLERWVNAYHATNLLQVPGS
ncbi:TPA: CRISPR-associated endonuclease Cas2 [Patescibacteria group bacterium]|nr:CRISPR-associated endonuclease Cas2 [Patescibacteria group bacterium]